MKTKISVILFFAHLLFSVSLYASEQDKRIKEFVSFISSSEISNLSEDVFRNKVKEFLLLSENSSVGKGKVSFIVEGGYMFSGCHGILESAYFTIESSSFIKIKEMLDQQFSGKSSKKKGKIIYGSCPKVALKDAVAGKDTIRIILYNCLDVC